MLVICAASFNHKRNTYNFFFHFRKLFYFILQKQDHVHDPEPNLNAIIYIIFGFKVLSHFHFSRFQVPVHDCNKLKCYCPKFKSKSK